MKKAILILALVLLQSCSNTTDSIQTNGGEWSLPITEVFDGGPGKDGIPALTNPNTTTVSNTSSDFLKDSDLVLAYKNGEDIIAYPHTILDWHEIINDNIGNTSVAITYCPLTGTGIGWNRILNNSETTFGVSGLLYNTNLIPYDRATDSNWSQILNESVNGELIGERIDIITLFETNWKTWKTLYPESKVVTTSTGFSRTYGTSPYGDYNTNNSSFFFPVAKDNRLPLKERVHSIVDGEFAKSYRFSDFTSNHVIVDTFKGNSYLIVGNDDFIVSFLLDDSKESTVFTYNYNGTEVLLSDSEGNEWNIFGEAITGPKTGEFLIASESFMGFWFSIPAFYTTEIYEN